MAAVKKVLITPAKAQAVLRAVVTSMECADNSSDAYIFIVKDLRRIFGKAWDPTGESAPKIVVL